MKKVLAFIFIILLLPAAAQCQVIRMEAGDVAFDFPDRWLCVSPQLCSFYTRELTGAGIEPEGLREQLLSQGILCRGYNETYSQWISVLMREDDLSLGYFDMSRADMGQRKQIRLQAEGNNLFEVTGLRTQDAEWQQISDRYWLYVHYIRLENGENAGRGIRYMTIHNGQWIIVDWQKAGRFSNRDLASFKKQLSGLVFTRDAEEPIRNVTVNAQLPSETNTGMLEVTGTATIGAQMTLLLTEDGSLREAAWDTAGNRGQFTLSYELSQQGETEYQVLAEREGMLPTTLTGTIYYDAKTIPLSGIDETITTTSDKTVIRGETLGGTTLQLVAPKGMTKKRAANDGSFSFELTTEQEGTYEYTLLLDKGNYAQRRFSFSIVRLMTDDQQKADVRKSAIRISYRDLQKDLPENRGQVLNIRGPVVEVSQNSGTTFVRMNYSRSTGKSWTNPVILVCEEDPGLRTGDMVTVLCRVEGIYVEQNAKGEDVNIPRLQMLFIDHVE